MSDQKDSSADYGRAFTANIEIPAGTIAQAIVKMERFSKVLKNLSEDENCLGITKRMLLEPDIEVPDYL